MDRRIEKIYAFIQRHCHEPLSLDLLASKAELSPFYFQRLFKKEMQETPTACINRVRLEKAAHLLKAGMGYSIAQVADECGFSSAAVFNRSFKAYYNTTPVQFSQAPSTLFTQAVGTVTFNHSAIEILYLPNIYLYGVATSIMQPNMMDAIDQATDFCLRKGIEMEGRKFGVLSHHTFHYPNAPKNYLLGVSVYAKAVKTIRDSLLMIPKGKYASFVIHSSVREVRSLLQEVKFGWLDQSPYTLRELIAYEEFLPTQDPVHYPYFVRRIYIPIQLK